MSANLSEKVVLIIAKDGDFSAKEVSDWTNYMCSKKNKRLYYINTDKNEIRITSVNFEGLNMEVEIEFDNYDNAKKLPLFLSDIESVYFRNGSLKYSCFTGVKSNLNEIHDIESRLKNFLMGHEKTIYEFLISSLKSRNQIGFNNGSFTNKLKLLDLAQKFGLTIPKTMLTTKKDDVIKFLNTNESVIIKSSGLNMLFIDKKDRKKYQQYTEEFTKQDLKRIPDNFELSMFQERIVKEFELRVFVIKDACYTSALLSQNNEKSALDYRHYDSSRPMRVIPYTLPKGVKEKLLQVMKSMEMNTGSFDLMFTKSGDYVFLELNPAGQYGANSDHCNFYLDREISKKIVR